MAVLRGVAVSAFGSVPPKGRVLPLVVRFRDRTALAPHHSGTPHLCVLSPLRYAPPLRSKSGVWSGSAPPRLFIGYRLPMPQSRSVPCSVRLFVLASTPPTSVRFLSFRTAVRFICLSAACLRPYWARPQLRGHSGGVGCPALSRSGVPPSPPRSTPLPLVAPRHGGRGYGRAVVGLRPPLFCRLARETKMALSRFRSGCRYASPCVRYASAAPFWFPAPAQIMRFFKIPNNVGTFSFLRDRIPTLLGISKNRQQINKCFYPAVAGGCLHPSTLPPSVFHGCGLSPQKVPLRAQTPHPPA